MSFRLTKKSTGKVLTTFHVLNSAGDICGSINCRNGKEADDLLRCWSGDKDSSPNLASKQDSPQTTLAQAFLANRRPFSQAVILRGS
jgi:hypothetical protein